MYNRFTRFLVGTTVALSLFGGAGLAQASSLTQTQISAIVNLLRSFGADEGTVGSVVVALGGQPGEQATCVNLSSTLTLGSTGYDVTNLQNYLIKIGALDAQYNTGYYGFLTAKAVGTAQIRLDVVTSASDPSYGIVGPRTRAALACRVMVNAPSITVDVDGGVHATIVYKNLHLSKLSLMRAVTNETIDTIDIVEGSGAREENLSALPAGNYYVRAGAPGTDEVRSNTFYISGTMSAQTTITVTGTARPNITFAYANIPTTDIHGVYVVSATTGTNVTSLPINGGTGTGSIRIPDSTPAGRYFLRVLAQVSNRTVVESSPFDLASNMGNPDWPSLSFSPFIKAGAQGDAWAEGLDIDGLVISIKNDSTLIQQITFPTNCWYTYKIYNAVNGALVFDLASQQQCVAPGTWPVTTFTLNPGDSKNIDFKHQNSIFHLVPGSYVMKVDVNSKNVVKEAVQFRFSVATTLVACPANAMSQRGLNGQTFRCMCPSNLSAKIVWGNNNYYTDDSDICTAGAQVGQMNLTSGGEVDYTIYPGQNAYSAWTQYGITSQLWGAWPGSFKITGPKG